MRKSIMTDILSPLRIGKHLARYPIVQGAMAVRVAGANLAGSVANAGGIGTIASMGLGLSSPYFEQRKRSSFFKANRLALIDELTKVRQISPDGIIGVNVLVATRDYLILAQTAAANGANLIVTGGGLPLSLPEYTADYPDVALVPSVANLYSAQLICQTWQQKYNRLPDALIVENCQFVGGHFTECDRVNLPGFSVATVLYELRHYCQEKLGVKIPLIVTGGISDRTDIDLMMVLGADGVQIGTRFITTEECDADRRYKEYHLNAFREDVVTVPSPVGKMTRALRNTFAQEVMDGCLSKEQRCIANCLETCLFRDTGKTYCILQALAKAANGDVENGLIFSGANVRYTEQIMSIAELMAELTQPCNIPV
ncbi:nitronate monooxygenase [Calothrix anomala]